MELTSRELATIIIFVAFFALAAVLLRDRTPLREAAIDVLKALSAWKLWSVILAYLLFRSERHRRDDGVGRRSHALQEFLTCRTREASRSPRLCLDGGGRGRPDPRGGSQPVGQREHREAVPPGSSGRSRNRVTRSTEANTGIVVVLATVITRARPWCT
ncbi:MAG: hypothetical protein QM604_03925 [Microbacterium sp.]